MFTCTECMCARWEAVMVKESALSLHFPSLSQRHSRHPHSEACAYKIHKHTHRRAHTRGGNTIQTTAFSTVGRIPRVWGEDRIKEKEKRREKASNLTSSDPFTHTCVQRRNTEWLGQLRDSDIIFGCPPLCLIWAGRMDWD